MTSKGIKGKDKEGETVDDQTGVVIGLRDKITASGSFADVISHQRIFLDKKGDVCPRERTGRRPFDTFFLPDTDCLVGESTLHSPLGLG